MNFFFPNTQPFALSSPFPAFSGSSSSTELGEFLYRKQSPTQMLRNIKISNLQGKIVLLEYDVTEMLDEKGKETTGLFSKRIKYPQVQYILQNFGNVAYEYKEEQAGSFSSARLWKDVEPKQVKSWKSFDLSRLFGFWYTVTGNLINSNVAKNSQGLRQDAPINVAFQQIYSDHVDMIKAPSLPPITQNWPNFIILDFIEENPLAIKICVSHNDWLHLVFAGDPTGLIKLNLNLRKRNLFSLLQAEGNVTRSAASKLRSLAHMINE